MPLTLPATFKTEIERPHGSNPMLWMVEIQLSQPFVSGGVVPSTLLRITSNPVNVLWPISSPAAEEWWPYNFSFSPIEQTQEGDLPQLDLSVDNSTRVLMRYLHNGEGLEGNYVQVYLVPALALSIAYPNHEYQGWRMQIAGCVANEESVSFRLERSNFFQRLAPQDRFVAARCRWAFGGSECGYVVNAAAAFTTCPKSVDACVARGADHFTRGLPVFHPRRFGGFPGIPQQR